MRCFTWEEGVVTGGITLREVVDDDVVYLGKNSRYWNHVCVGLYEHNAPEVFEDEVSQERFVEEAFPVTMKYSTSSGVRFVLAKPDSKHEGDSRTLVLVDTKTEENSKRDPGFWRTLQGDVETIAVGIIQKPDGTKWKRGLLRLDDGDILRVSTSGLSGKDYVLFQEDGELVTYDWVTYAEEEGA